jgi:prepilin-type N-terminal cleavage/methylation domain-containing protein
MTKGKRTGFTLLELLTVMAIMALLSTLAVTSYFGAVRGMARKSAVNHLANTLALARQRACMEGSRMCVMLYNEVLDNATPPSVAPSFVVCKEIGHISYAPGDSLGDEFANLSSIFGLDEDSSDISSSYETLKLFNLTQGKWTYVYPRVIKKTIRPTGFDSEDQQRSYTIPIYCFRQSQAAKTLQGKNSRATLGFGNWKVGDSYGIEATPPTSLPKRFSFDQMQKSNYENVLFVTFNADGSVSQSKTFTIIDSLDNKSTTVQVSTQGRISYTGKWH